MSEDGNKGMSKREIDDHIQLIVRKNQVCTVHCINQEKLSGSARNCYKLEKMILLLFQ